MWSGRVWVERAEVFRNNRGPLHERLVTALEAQRIINQNERSMMYKKA